MFEHWPFLTCIVKIILYSLFVCQYRLEKLTRFMYFERVLIYPVAFYKWHLFNELLGTYLTAADICCNTLDRLKGLNVPLWLSSALFQSCLFVCQHPLANFSRFCWDCKGRNLFVIVKLFIFYFFEAFRPLLKSKPWQVPLLYTSFKIFCSNPFNCFPSSEAGCKSRKILATPKHYLTIIC